MSLLARDAPDFCWFLFHYEQLRGTVREVHHISIRKQIKTHSFQEMPTEKTPLSLASATRRCPTLKINAGFAVYMSTTNRTSDKRCFFWCPWDLIYIQLPAVHTAEEEKMAWVDIYWGATPQPAHYRTFPYTVRWRIGWGCAREGSYPPLLPRL